MPELLFASTVSDLVTAAEATKPTNTVHVCFPAGNTWTILAPTNEVSNRAAATEASMDSSKPLLVHEPRAASITTH
jgi:hypothetical protein